MFHHGKNLGLFVFLYKTICFILRNYGVRGGIECWIAGFIGGYIGFGESKMLLIIKLDFIYLQEV